MPGRLAKARLVSAIVGGGAGCLALGSLLYLGAKAAADLPGTAWFVGASLATCAVGLSVWTVTRYCGGDGE